jgi:hypothetical protein
MMNATLAIQEPIPSLLSQISDLQPHSCTWCRRIVIDPGAAVKLSPYIRGFTVGYKEEDIRSASRDGCSFFVRITRDRGSFNSHISDTVFLLFELMFHAPTVRGGPEPSDIRNSEQRLGNVRVSSHMQDPISTPTSGEIYRGFLPGVVYQTSLQYGE